MCSVAIYQVALTATSFIIAQSIVMCVVNSVPARIYLILFFVHRSICVHINILAIVYKY